MDIYQRLKEDHEVQRDLADKLMDTSGDSDERRVLFEKIKSEIEAHAAAEEETFYADLMKKPDGQEQARHSVTEHKEAADLIEELTDMDMSSGGWIQKFEKLKDDLVHHMDEEENEVFKLAKKLFDDETEQDMADKFDKRKEAEQV